MANGYTLRTLAPALVLTSALLSGCGAADEPERADTMAIPATVEETLRQAFEAASPGDIITIPPGTHAMTRPLVLNSDGITIRGAGMDQSILSFKGQIAGAEGILVTGSDFVIEDMAVEDTIGDAIKINDGKNIVVRRVRTEWTRGPHTDNGAYGVYPVQTENTLLDGVVAIAASDAGIYVGQSRNVVVKNSHASYNVAGIEIENTVNADVYDNLAENNTGGILVFNMPGIPMEGHSTRVYQNKVLSNNTGNFAAAGTAVSGVPAGSGIVINSNDKVEVFNNTFADNNTAHILISSYFSANYAGQRELAAEFDPYPEDILIYDNQYSGGGTKPDVPALEQARVALYGPEGALPAAVWDGIGHPERGSRICIAGETGMLNIDSGNEGANVTNDMSAHRCELPRLSAVQLTL
ncbi:MAG: parallel beta-helix domain-containing protein [Pseudomonadales bacterium]